MHPALGASGLDRVAANAAPAGHQALGIGGNGQRVGVLHLNVRCPAQQVLAALGSTHGRVVGRRAVPAGDRDGLAKVLPDGLQQHHEGLVDHHDVGAVAAPELAYLKARCQLPGPVCFQAILFDCHFLTSFPAGQAPVFSASSSVSSLYSASVMRPRA